MVFACSTPVAGKGKNVTINRKAKLAMANPHPVYRINLAVLSFSSIINLLST
jgi:hypothetical protein